MEPDFWARRLATAIYKLGWDSLSYSEESALQNDPVFAAKVEEILAELKGEKPRSN